MYELLEKEMKRCNEMCNQLWDSVNQIKLKIESTEDEQTKNALEQHKWLIGAIAELYYLHASIRGDLLQTNDLVQALRREVFGQETITLPHEPQKDATLAETASRYKQNEPEINWIVRGLREEAKDTEKKEEGANNNE